MKLLIVTQNVDRTDPILGFFHGWIAEFARHLDAVTVIGQQVGEYDLPRNVTVKSLYKEKKLPPLLQVLRSYALFWRHRHSYDAVFVHMTPIWIVIGAPLWLLLRKRMYLWYEVKRGSQKLALALCFVRKVFAATEHGIPGTSKKLVVVGHGIDTTMFFEGVDRGRDTVVALGRITRIKNYDQILRAFAALPSSTKLIIAGGTVTDIDKQEKKTLEHLADDLGIRNRIEMRWVAPDDVPELLQRAALFLHASQGGLDKAILQAMACGCPVVSTSIAAQDILPELCKATEESFADKASALYADSSGVSSALRSIVEKQHSLPECIERLTREMRSN